MICRRRTICIFRSISLDDTFNSTKSNHQPFVKKRILAVKSNVKYIHHYQSAFFLYFCIVGVLLQMVMWWWSRMIILEPNRRMLTCIEFYYITIWLLNRNHSFKPPPQICKTICIFICICLVCLYLSCNISNALYIQVICISLYTHHVHIDRCMSFTIFDKRQTWDFLDIMRLLLSCQVFCPKCATTIYEWKRQILGKNHVCESCKICQVPNWVSTENLA